MYVTTFEQRITSGCAVEIIGQLEHFDRLRGKFASAFETALEAETTQLLVSDDLPGFGVGLLDNGGVIATYDGNMRPETLLEASSDQQELVEWIEQQYESQKASATAYER